MPENTATPSPKVVTAFAFRSKVQASPTPAPAPAAHKPVVIPAQAQPRAKVVEKLSAQVKPKVEVTGLRNDGPTLEEFEAAGGDPGEYPPKGYAERKTLYRFAKLSGTAAKTVFADKSFFQWRPIRRSGGGYAPTTSCETTDASLAAKLREAAKTDRSIREAPPQ